MRDRHIETLARLASFHGPTIRFVASIHGDATLLDGDVIRREGPDVVVQTGAGPLRADADAASYAVGDTVTVAVRPEA